MDRARLNAIVDLEISKLRQQKRTKEEELREITNTIFVLGQIQKEYNINEKQK